MTPRTYVNLKVNPANEAEVLGQYVGQDGEISEQWYLVATMSGSTTGRRVAAAQLANYETLARAAQEGLRYLATLPESPEQMGYYHTLAKALQLPRVPE